MSFIAEKDPGIIPQILSVILHECTNGVTLADPDLEDMRIVYANKAFEIMTGYSQEEIIGHNAVFFRVTIGITKPDTSLPKPSKLTVWQSSLYATIKK
ncbi:MAG: PAS domain S-box protein [Methylovulum sp.]